MDFQALRNAVAEQRLSIVYQPIFCTKTFQPIAAEVLLRLVDQQGERVSPESFIQALEGSELEQEVFEWVLSQAWEESQSWGLSHSLSLAFNVSPALLSLKLLDAVKRLWPAPDRLEIEVTERMSLCTREEAFAVSVELRRLGVKLLYDDYCATPACEERLRQLPFTGVKIDRSILPELLSMSAPQLGRHAVMAKKLQLNTVAEGLEFAPDIVQIAEAGFDRWQGFFSGVPMPGAEFKRWFSLGLYQQPHMEIQASWHDKQAQGEAGIRYLPD